MFGWIIIFFSVAGFYFLAQNPRSKVQKRLAFVSIFIAAYMGGIELWPALILKIAVDTTALLAR